MIQAAETRLNWHRRWKRGNYSKKHNGTIQNEWASIYQPDKDMGYNLETTYSEGSNRTQFGKALLTPLFTVEQYSYEASNVPVVEANKILKIIAKGKTFNLYHWSLYHMAWRTDPFYVGRMQRQYCPNKTIL